MRDATETAIRRRDRGIARTSIAHRRDIADGQLRLLRYLLAGHTGSLDDADDFDSLTVKYRAGHWRGAITLGLLKSGVIQKVGFKSSNRLHRHRGCVHTYAIANHTAAAAKLDALMSEIEDIDAK
jgi:hypothetical protein